MLGDVHVARLKTTVDYALTIVALGLSVSLFLVAERAERLRGSAFPVPVAPVSIRGAVLKGNPLAPVILIEWADYECPYCSKTERILMPQIQSAFIDTAKVQLAFLHHPVTSLHPHSEKAAEAAVCASRQGLFWQMHQAIFADQSHLEVSDLLRRSHELGLDGRFERCLTGNEATEEVQRDASIGESADPMGVPTFMVGRRLGDERVKVFVVLRKMQPFREFAAAIDKVLRK